MTNNDNAWAWFDEQHTDKVSSSAVPHELHKAFARLLTYPEASSVLAHLHGITRKRVFGPETSEAVLRYAEGQKALVAYVERMAAKGRGDQTLT